MRLRSFLVAVWSGDGSLGDEAQVGGCIVGQYWGGVRIQPEAWSGRLVSVGRAKWKGEPSDILFLFSNSFQVLLVAWPLEPPNENQILFKDMPVQLAHCRGYRHHRSWAEYTGWSRPSCCPRLGM